MAGVDPVFIEHLAEALCGISAVLFTFIATFSRSEKAEYNFNGTLMHTSPYGPSSQIQSFSLDLWYFFLI